MDTSAGDKISCICGETPEKARCELGEDPKTRGTIIQELRDKIEHWEPSPEDEGLTFSRKDDKFLLRYLRAKKFDTDRALQLYVNYHRYRKKYEHVSGEITPKAAEHILKTGLVSVLPERSRSGSMQGGSNSGVIVGPSDNAPRRYSEDCAASSGQADRGRRDTGAWI